jgi:hypothetical protein
MTDERMNEWTISFIGSAPSTFLIEATNHVDTELDFPIYYYSNFVFDSSAISA